MDIKIFSKNGQLYGQATGQPAFPLTKKAENTFAFQAANVKIKFSPKENSLKLTQHGASYDLKRKPD